MAFDVGHLRSELVAFINGKRGLLPLRPAKTDQCGAGEAVCLCGFTRFEAAPTVTDDGYPSGALKERVYAGSGGGRLLKLLQLPMA